jgi:hypothetical protein
MLPEHVERRLLVDPPNALAAIHLEAAATKILGAVRSDAGSRDVIVVLDGRVQGPDGDPWRERFRPLEALFSYKRKVGYNPGPAPNIDALRQMLATLLELRDVARREL